MRRKGEARAKPAPTDSAAAERTTATPAARLEAHLRDELAAAEAALAQLGLPPQAWQSVRAYLTDTMPAFGAGEMADTLLGPRAPTDQRGVIPTRALPAVRAITGAARRCPRCRAALASVREPLRDHVMIEQAQDHHKPLFDRYLAQVNAPVPPVIREMPAWAAAQRAATATAALREIDSPLACFAAGAYLEQQRLVAWANRTLVPRATAKAKRLFLEGVQRGKFPAVEQVAVGRARAKAASEMHAQRARDHEPIQEAVRQEYARLCAAGSSKRAAVRAIVEQPDSRERIQAVAAGARPWGRREFYSYSGVRRIVGL
jgi:hypothetical protein